MKPLPWTEEEGEMAGGGHSRRPARAPKGGGAPAGLRRWKTAQHVRLDTRNLWWRRFAPGGGGCDESAAAAHWPAVVAHDSAWSGDGAKQDRVRARGSSGTRTK
jgi:hypothetical protein